MKKVWMGVHQEGKDDWLCIAQDASGDEITHDRAVSMHTAIGMVVSTLARLYETVTIIHLQFPTGSRIVWHKEKK